jgi:glutamine amidotransferase
MIAIINYGLGNLGSIQNMLKKIGCSDVIISNDRSEIDKADKLILPGVGAFDNGMSKINESGLLDVLNENVLIKKKPVLGICLGMQLLTRGSEEGKLKGLGWIDADTMKFSFESSGESLKIPHMGWNYVKVSKQHSLVKNIDNTFRFYFVHSYYVSCKNESDPLLKSHYGIDFTCAVQKENIMGVQFHPEKSHKYGMQLLKNFVDL